MSLTNSDSVFFPASSIPPAPPAMNLNTNIPASDDFSFKSNILKNKHNKNLNQESKDSDSISAASASYKRQPDQFNLSQVLPAGVKPQLMPKPKSIGARFVKQELPPMQLASSESAGNNNSNNKNSVIQNSNASLSSTSSTGDRSGNRFYGEKVDTKYDTKEFNYGNERRTVTESVKTVEKNYKISIAVRNESSNRSSISHLFETMLC